MTKKSGDMFCRHLFFYYATAQLIPNAVPTAARIADPKFHKKRISLVLFSLVIKFFFN